MLKRAMGLLPATAMVAGIIIGASIFVQPSVISSHVPSAKGIIAAWLIAGALTAIGALICAELASAFQRSGGVYVFLSESFGPGAGFLWGWAMFWVMHTGIAAAIAMICARHVAFFVPLGAADGFGIKAVAIAAVAALTFINVRGVKPGARVQTVLTLLKVAAIVGIVALIFTSPRAVDPATLPPGEFTLRGLALAVGAGLFAYGGWHMVTYASEEIVTPERTIPRALILGIIVVTLAYLALNAAYLRVMPLERLINSRSVATDATGMVIGANGAAIVAAVVIVSTLGALNGVLLAGPRVYYAMAKDGLMLRRFATTHPSHLTPHLSLWLQALWAAVLILTGTYGQLFSRVIYTEWIFFAAMAVGLLILRRRASYTPAFRLPAAPLLVSVFTIVSLGVVAAEITKAPMNSAIGLGIVLLGLPVYLIWKRT